MDVYPGLSPHLLTFYRQVHICMYRHAPNYTLTPVSESNTLTHLHTVADAGSTSNHKLKKSRTAPVSQSNGS